MMNSRLKKTFYTVSQASRVKRWHNARTIHQETLAEHHAITAQVLLMLFPATHSFNLLAAAVTHDLGEVGTGDIPSPTKDKLNLREALDHEERNYNPFISYQDQLNNHEKLLLKFADVFARVVFLYNEKMMGNKTTEEKLFNAVEEVTRITTAHFPWLERDIRDLLEEIILYQ